MFQSDPKRQQKLLVDMVDAAVAMLDTREKLEGALAALGKRHVKYGTENVHYPIVGTNLLGTLEKILGSDVMDKDAKLAWATAYDHWSRVMIEAAQVEQ